MYFTAPADVSGDFTISITAQLAGAGAMGADWKVEMFSFLPVDNEIWEPVGDLTGGKLCGIGTKVSLWEPPPLRSQPPRIFEVFPAP